ncbi:MAG: hypothetical protein CBC35_08370 [Planctomycetes bacterium TMED75]|nr:acylphosphatase [Planctomycetaceae bacterium]OUU92005.1 MAG: hypothetical protein CBC35_08370 [Planctomycetes bacterium TMED75]
MTPTNAELIFHGRVQGVGFRATARDHARGVGLRGWVRNEADGTVRLVAQGPSEAVDCLRGLLESSFGAKITLVEQQTAFPVEEFSGFRILRG